MPNEEYVPSKEEIQAAEMMMTDEQKNMSEGRTNSYNKLESFLGLKNTVSLAELINTLYADKITQQDAECRTVLFHEHGVEMSPYCAPERFNFSRLEVADWENIRNSQIPAITLMAASNHNDLRDYFKKKKSLGKISRYTDLDLPPRREAEINAFLRSLPLVHSTSVDALDKILSAGKLISNKRLYFEGKKSALEFHSDSQGTTTLMDRTLGLDEYVFADFARPHVYHSQQEVTIVIDPDTIFSPGVFMTAKDVLDCDIANPLPEYLSSSLTPEYFYEAAKLKIAKEVTEEREVGSRGVYESQSSYNTIRQFSEGQDGYTYTNIGKQLNFSTWEVKLPEVPVSAIRKVIFRDQQQFDNFRERFQGGDFELVYEPNLKGNQYHVLKIAGEFEKQFNTIRDSTNREQMFEEVKKYHTMDDAEFETFRCTDTNKKLQDSYSDIIHYRSWYGPEYKNGIPVHDYPSRGKETLRTRHGVIHGEVVYISFKYAVIQTLHDNIAVPFEDLVSSEGKALAELTINGSRPE
ncbi:MAG: hypothetical protein UV48_C0029G0004 [Candidatus Azambacteria bacterium GW2011_GWA2_42_9]|uniref:Uncharacterized protein n=2 Tax=Candidatus Azamiibacteriota TaxID=1752741 RepID=A0A0G0Z4S1_9BACT|nr:MAG: hypothetical protein UV07_C0026G0004 [Candidatus Azambacteria bacterium GW2011_GWB1_42_17]KKS74740.1 MAG: hypothetical protein UV48_C0029G0004 [Candidatus Azambacteria bacterium GW2011_GWA2_42_9]KKS87828.1 MAG: hypothetical protein UV62_C0024G0004 [Parcubacteria group bacterium GW2011_GWC1_43_11]